MKWAASSAIALVSSLVASASSAAFVSFDLTQSDQMRDGAHYVRVTIDDNNASGLINFHVSLLDPLRDRGDRHDRGHGFDRHQRRGEWRHVEYGRHAGSGSRLGIDEFAFNSDLGVPSSSFVGLPNDWKAGGAVYVPGFGRFDESVEAKSRHARVKTLDFSIAGLDWDTIESYLDPSVGRAREGNMFFAVHVAGFDSAFRCITGVTFGGGVDPVNPVPAPLPASTGLLAAGLGLFGALAWIRRRPDGPARGFGGIAA
ncbi:MAG: hypothetical protein ABI771_06525 [Betaproteobacteria bacterium]